MLNMVHWELQADVLEVPLPRVRNVAIFRDTAPRSHSPLSINVSGVRV